MAYSPASNSSTAYTTWPASSFSESISISVTATESYTALASNTPGSSSPASITASNTVSDAASDTASATASAAYTGTTSGTSTSAPTAVNGTAGLTSSQTSNSDGKFNSGTLAGAIVGSFLGGCLLAFLAAFLFFRRKKPQPGDSSAWAADKGAASKSVDGVSAYAAPLPAKSLPVTTTALAGAAAGLDLAAYASQPAEDSAVCMRVQVLLDQIGLHIDNYYSRTTSNPPLTSDIVARIAEYDSSNLPASITTILSTPKAQRPVLIHVLAQSTLQAIQPGTQGLSLLPACYALAPQRQRVDSADTNTIQALFAWRMLTSHLTTNNQTTPIPPNDSIDSFAEAFTQAFAPYSSAQFTETDRLRHLNNVCKAASDLGIWLFSQPCSFEFRWNGGGHSPDEIVTNPAVVKVGDEHGQQLAVPQVLAEETTVRI